MRALQMVLLELLLIAIRWGGAVAALSSMMSQLPLQQKQQLLMAA